MSFKLVDSGWTDELDAGMRERPDAVLIVCPFIKRRTVERLLFAHRPLVLRVITRFDLNGFNAGVSDLDALDLLIQNGAKIRGVVGVHSKMYIFGAKRAIVTSANLTEAAMFQNKEFGFSADDPFIAAQCQSYSTAYGAAPSTICRKAISSNGVIFSLPTVLGRKTAFLYPTLERR